MAMATARRSGAAPVAVPELLVALFVAGLGVFTVVDAHRINIPVSSNVVGPRVFPYAVGAALVLAGAAIVLGLLRGRGASPEGGEDVDLEAPTDWVTLAKVVAAFMVHVALVDRLGWALAGATLFALVAWALGAHLLKATVIGLVLGLTVQVVFVTGLGVTLPPGIFEGVTLLGG